MGRRLGRSAVRLATVGLLASVVLAACGSARPPVNGSGSPEVVMIIRHAEKPDGPDVGVDQQGKEDASSLTAAGWERARRLVDLFGPAPGSARNGVRRPGTIYAAGANDDGEGLRTRQTVAPLSTALGLPVNTDFGKGEEEELAKEVLAHPGAVLISWQHSGIPDIVRGFPAVTPTPPKDWPSDRFDVVWTLTRTGTGWHFAQVPQRLLPGDGTDVIPD
jgi:broad specificity phosphatase PhoE